MSQSIPSQPVSISSLSEEQAAQILDLYNRYLVLSASKVHTRESDAEREGVTTALMGMLLEFTPTLLGAWFTIKKEYEPLCQGFFQILQRVDAQRFATMQHLQRQAEAATKTDGSTIVKEIVFQDAPKEI